METKSRKRFVEAWKNHIDCLWALTWTPSKNLSEEVKETIEKLELLIEAVATDKGLKGGIRKNGNI